MNQDDLLQVPYDSPRAVLAPGHSYGSVTDEVVQVVLKPVKKTGLAWWIAFAVSFLLLLMLIGASWYTIDVGVGLWGINIPVAWGFAISNYVWWISIAVAGTLVSSTLLLVHQQWRNSINRVLEAMTIQSILCASLMPLLHMGREWLFYWVLPYPNTMRLQPQFRSSLVWDAFAISTIYLTISFLSLYSGLIPDFATMRDHAHTHFARLAYGFLALGWRGSVRHWKRFKMYYLILAAIATPLVVSVHSVTSFTYSITIVPGWQETIFPPYFVAGAVTTGMGMALMLLVPVRAYYGFKDLITIRHLENVAKILLLTACIVGYSYGMEAFFSFYSGSIYERQSMIDRVLGRYGYVFIIVLITVVAFPQLLWIRKLRRSPGFLFAIGMIVQAGMWGERYMITVQSLYRDYLPSSWGYFSGSKWDYFIFIGSFGLFFTMQLLLLRLVPIVSISEMREIIEKLKQKRAGP